MNSMSEYARGVLNEDALAKLNEQMAGVLSGLCIAIDNVVSEDVRGYFQQLINDEVRCWDERLMEYGKELVEWRFDAVKGEFLCKIEDLDR